MPGETVLESGSMNFPNFKAAQRSPLATELFKIEGVTGVFFASDFITVSKDADVEWHILKPFVFSTIAEHFASGAPLVAADGDAVSAANTEILDDDDEVVAMIKELLETRVRPAVQADGGDIIYMGFEHGIVLLQVSFFLV